MRDKDTKILEETYSKILKEYDSKYDFGPEELHEPSEQNNGVETIIIPLERSDGELYEDIPVDVEWEIYRGSTPARGDDPTDITIRSAVINDDVVNDNGDVVVQAGTDLNDLEGFVVSANIQEMIEEILSDQNVY